MGLAISTSTTWSEATPMVSATPFASGVTSAGAPGRQASANPLPSAAPLALTSPSGAMADTSVPAGAEGISAGSLPRDLSPTRMFIAATGVVQGVMLLLTVASVVVWTVCISKGLQLARAKRQARAIRALITDWSTLRAEGIAEGGGPAAAMVRAAIDEIKASPGLSPDGIKERIVIQLERIVVAARGQIVRGTGLLATIGATAPFVGLFGTVWGIMHSFIGISKANTTNLAIVAPGIAEALMATAFGLEAAIPAVIIYNVFARASANYRMLLDDVFAEIMCLTGRDLERRGTEYSSWKALAR